ncbi:MAG: carbon storage regulator [Bryobacteraceae bacterium]|jgi:carbon storage regulator
MLMMSRRQGETIRIGDDIEIVIAGIHGSRVKVGIRAPREMPVVMREIKLVKEENLAAAKAPQVAVWSSMMEHFQRTAAGARDHAGGPAPRR